METGRLLSRFGPESLQRSLVQPAQVDAPLLGDCLHRLEPADEALAG